MSTVMRSLGMTAEYAPKLKRGVMTHPTSGLVHYFVPDTNLATSNGADTTGTPKFYIYRADDGDRDSFTLLVTDTPATTPASATKWFVGSAAMSSDGDIHVVYQGTDNSLRYTRYNWNGASYDAGADQTVVAANAVTDRYRAIDIDVINTLCPAVIVYEASASSGVGATARIYVRLDDGTSWVQAYQESLLSGVTIRQNSEDVSVSIGSDGIVSNVMKIAFFSTRTSTASDLGDVVREITFNTNTGTTNSATLVGSWDTDMYKGLAASSRRLWLFRSGVDGSDPFWTGVGLVGTSSIFAHTFRVKHNTFPASITINKTSVQPSTVAPGLRNAMYNSVDLNKIFLASTTYQDNMASVAVVGYSPTKTGPILREFFMRYTGQFDYATDIKDTNTRLLDNNFKYDTSSTTGALAVYGGDQTDTHNDAFQVNYWASYGKMGDSVSTTPGTNARSAYVIAEPVIAAPTIVAPVGSAVSSNTPVLAATVLNTQLYSPVRGSVGFQVASNLGFSVDVHTYDPVIPTDSLSFDTLDGTTNPTKYVQLQVPEDDPLAPGFWYMRAYVVDDHGGISAYSSTETFTIYHPPSAEGLIPADNSIAVSPGADLYDFSWLFSDTASGDTQTAYQVVIVRQDTLATVEDTGKVASSTAGATIEIDASLKDIQLSWSVSLWDGGDDQGAFSTPIFFTVSDAPTISVDSPADGSTETSPMPTVTWTFGGSGGRTQQLYRVVITNTDEGDALVVDTGWVASAATSHAFTSNILALGVNYKVSVTVRDSGGLEATSATNDFDTDWIEPALGDITVDVTDPTKAIISWTDANQDMDFVAWRVYRRYNEMASTDWDINDTATTWVLIHETNEVETSYSYYDYLAPLNKATDYVVVQVADRFGSLVESDITAYETVTLVGDRYYFVPEVPIGVVAAMEAQFVTSDSFQDEIEQATLVVAGRGRQVQQGEDLGYTGALTLKLRNPASARGDREFIQLMAKPTTGNVYIRSPFGDVLYVAFMTPSFDRLAGVGTSDLGDLIVPYLVVYGDIPVTRAG